MVRKKGYLRSVEAFIAIGLLLIFMYTVIPKHKEVETDTPLTVISAQEYILNGINQNNTLRDCVLTDTNCVNSDSFIQFIEDNLPIGYDYCVDICEETSCSCPVETPLDKSIYMRDTFVSKQEGSTRVTKIVRLWIWKRD